MTVVDVTILLIICMSALFSLMRGFVKEAISLSTWIVGVWVSATFASQMAEVLPIGIDSVAVKQAVGFAVLFLLTLLVGALVNYMVSQIIKKTGLSGADRLIGVGFGFVRGVFIILAFVFVGGMTPLPELEWWQTSYLLEHFEGLAIMLQDYMPTDVNVSFDAVKSVQQSIKP